MNIYKGLMFLDGFRIPLEDVDDVETPAIAAPRRPTPRVRAPAARGWRRALRGVAVFAGVLPVQGGSGGCG